jgi:hypothetical protein
MAELIDRKTAKALGLKYYFTGTPCIRGGIAQRLVSNFACVCRDCLELRNDQVKDYAKKNRVRLLDKARKWRAENPEKYKASVKNWHVKHAKQSIDARKAWESRNRDLLCANQDRYRRANLSKISARQAGRRAAKTMASVKWMSELTNFVVSEAAELAALRFAATGVGWSIDHMIPLKAKSASGLHVWNNIQVIPSRLNSSKNNRMVMCGVGEWIGCC